MKPRIRKILHDNNLWDGSVILKTDLKKQIMIHIDTYKENYRGRAHCSLRELLECIDNGDAKILSQRERRVYTKLKQI